ncbi:unnamed protein product [Caenorhabditis auriculariae]|uniref:Synembryn n=1 Tax=Caenorhabditis auriculariae TaxID=2777116 RepID=A0A8S1HMK7_9PELO|nr:unnamed protein product [Caenorhabditis auriculariae]
MTETGSLDVSQLEELSKNSSEEIKSFFIAWNAKNAAQSVFGGVDYFARQEVAKIIESKSEDSDLAPFLLETIRILSRQQTSLDTLLTNDVCKYITDHAGFTESQKIFVKIPSAKEASKCLINTLFHSAKMRSHFEKTGCHSKLQSRLSEFAAEKFSVLKWLEGAPEEEVEDFWYMDLRLSFISTAYSGSFQSAWSNDEKAISVLCEPVKIVLKEDNHGSASQKERAMESLKTLFNILCHANESVLSENQVIELNLMLHDAFMTSDDEKVEQAVVNVFSTPPVHPHLPTLCPKRSESAADVTTETTEKELAEKYDFSYTEKLLQRLESKLDSDSENSKMTDGLLETYLTALIRLCSYSKPARRFCRLKILPPLKKSDVLVGPELGTTIRNKLVRVMTQATCAKELTSEFLFILCKRSVPRLIKYTGFGHSAGLLANSGLLGQINSARQNSDSEDSETEDYNAVRQSVNPVTGTLYAADRGSALAGMSEEQKEYEALKLVEAMHRMMDAGLVKPGTIGEDGKVREVSHVLELAKDVVNESSDED